jgi:cell fate regulator YaaT (PSP1 superfamily)
MRKIVKIRFKPAGKLYDFDCGAFVLNKDDNVIVETEQGLGLGIVAISPFPYEEKLSNRPLKQVFRLANEDDFKQKKKNLVTEKRLRLFALTA